MLRGRRLLVLLGTGGALVAPAAASAKPAAAVRYAGTQTAKAGKGGDHPVSFTLTGTTVSKLTIGPGVAQCRPNGQPNDAPDAPFTTTSPKLVLPKLSLGKGVARASVGLTLQAYLVRDSLTAPWKTNKTPQVPASDKLTLGFSVASVNTKLGSFTSVKFNLAGLAIAWPSDATGAFNASGKNVCEVIGPVTVTKKK